jgi:histidinol-phosphate aminotransferase
MSPDAPSSQAVLDRHLCDEVLQLPIHVRSSREGMLNLASNELVHPRVQQLLGAVIKEIEPGDVHSYPFASSFAAEFADVLGVAADQLLLSAGSDDALKILVEAATRRTRSVLTQDPNYEEVARYARLRNLRVRLVPFGSPWPDAFDMRTFCRTLAALPPTTAIISNPNGPTGFAFSLAEVEELAVTCARFRHLLVIDEAYAGFAGFDHLEIMRRHEHVAIVRSLSKGMGMAGARLAVTLGTSRLIAYLARWNPANPVAGPSLAIARGLLRQGREIAATRAEIAATRERFRVSVLRVRHGWRALPSLGNFVNFDTGTEDAPDRVAEHFARNGVLIRSMRAVPQLSSCVRFTIADAETMARVLTILRELDLEQVEGRLRGGGASRRSARSHERGDRSQ